MRTSALSERRHNEQAMKPKKCPRIKTHKTTLIAELTGGDK